MHSGNLHKVTITNYTLPGHPVFSFYGVIPDSLTESHGADFATMDIMSRSGQLFSYSGGTSRTIDITISTHEDYIAAFTGGKADIRDYVAKFKALTYPEYSGTVVRPPELLLRVGNCIKFHGICESASVTWQKPFRNDHYIVADLNLSLKEANRLAFSASEIFYGDDLRRI